MKIKDVTENKFNRRGDLVPWEGGGGVGGLGGTTSSAIRNVSPQRGEKFMGQADVVGAPALAAPAAAQASSSNLLNLAAPAAAATMALSQNPASQNAEEKGQGTQNSTAPAAPAAAPAAEAPAAAPAAASKQNAGTKAGYKGSAGAQAIAKASGIADVNKIKPGQVLKIPGQPDYTVKKGDTLDAIARKSSAAAPAAKPNQAAAADPSVDPYDPAKDTNVTQVAASDGTTQDIERLKRLAIGGEQPVTPPTASGDQTAGGKTNADFLPGVAGGAKTDTAEPVAGQRPGGIAFNQDAGTTSGQGTQAATPAPNVNALGVAQTANVPGFGQSVPQTGQGTQSDADKSVATTPQVNPDTGLNAEPKPVTTGTGGKTNMVTGSDDEMAWRAKNPQWNMTGAQYPGAGKWDPKTGRSKVAQAQADANAAAVKGFFNKINPFAKKEQPTASTQQGQGTQSATPTSPPQTPGGYGRFQESSAELDRIKRLSGL